MRFSTMIIRNMTNRTARTVLTVLGLSVGIAAVMILMGVAEGFEKSFLAIYQSKGIDLVVVKGGINNQLSSNLQASLADKIRAAYQARTRIANRPRPQPGAVAASPGPRPALGNRLISTRGSADPVRFSTPREIPPQTSPPATRTIKPYRRLCVGKCIRPAANPVSQEKTIQVTTPPVIAAPRHRPISR